MRYREFVREQIQCFMDHDPSLKSKYEVYFMPGFKAIKTWRLTHSLYKKGHFVLARYLSLRCQRKTGIDIHPGATIGHRFFIDHGVGVVIGETCIIGDDVMVYQGVTLGGTGKEKGKRHPTVEDRVLIGAGAKIIGNIVLGHDCRVGSGAIVIRNVDPYVTVVSPPAYPVRDKRKKIPNLCPAGHERWTRDDIEELQDGRISDTAPCKVRLKVIQESEDAEKAGQVTLEEISVAENENPEPVSCDDCISKSACMDGRMDCPNLAREQTSRKQNKQNHESA